jgi:DNA repair exonuclease SbcCD ATPase subunit
MIIFKKIRWKNFLSTGNQFIEIDLNKSQTTLIIGANGSGKSTLLDALCFSLFNRPFRNIKKEQMVNTINQNDTIVELEFTTGTKLYKIIRGVKPTIFEIYCDGELLNQEASSIDYQNVLEDQILKLNYRAFKQVITLGSSSYQPFMQMRPRHRREVVEEILDIRVLTHMDILTRNQQTDLTSKITDARHQCDIVQSKYDLEFKHLQELKHRSLDDIDVKKINLKKNQDAQKDYLQKIQLLDNDYKQLQDNIQDFFEENDSCPTCTQPLEPEFRGEKRAYEKGKITTLNDGMKKLVEEITKVEDKLTTIDKLSKKMYDIQIEMSKINTSIDAIKNHSDNLHNEIILLENRDKDTSKIEQELEDFKRELEETKLQLDKILEEKKYVDVVREVLSDRGAKAKIIKKYLPIMNTLINQYLQAMDFFHIVSFR